MPPELAHRFDRYVMVVGTRFRLAFGGTIYPIAGESVDAFARRMACMDERLRAMPNVADVRHQLEQRSGLITECSFEVSLIEPEFAPIEADPRPAGRRAEPRGCRGGSHRREPAELALELILT